MKKAVLFLGCFICFFNTFAQCVVDAGEPIIVCVMGNGRLQAPLQQIGGMPVILQGTPPYKIRWYHRAKIGDSLSSIAAGYYLNDTTTGRPFVVGASGIGVGSALQTWFHLKVEDGLGQIGWDSVQVGSSGYVGFPDGGGQTIRQGDTTQIHATVSGGIPPVHYSWTPNNNMSDTTIGSPLVWPTATTLYYSTAIDSAGCRSTFISTWLVRVTPLSNSKLGRLLLKTSVYPNPIDETSVLQMETSVAGTYTLQVHDILGRKIVEQPLENGFAPIGSFLKRSGWYYYSIWYENERLFTAKLLKQTD